MSRQLRCWPCASQGQPLGDLHLLLRCAVLDLLHKWYAFCGHRFFPENAVMDPHQNPKPSAKRGASREPLEIRRILERDERIFREVVASCAVIAGFILVRLLWSIDHFPIGGL
jgi:hypothetical protein